MGCGRVVPPACASTPSRHRAADFVLNRAPWRGAEILVDGSTFRLRLEPRACALGAARFRHPLHHRAGFAEIFYGNCFKNGILPIALPRATIDLLMAEAADPATARMTIDLAAGTIAHASGLLDFTIDAQRRERLLGGWTISLWR
jgi:3-isopropylmalate/(R)-2-methylmalate dehydratase small subunit